MALALSQNNAKGGGAASAMVLGHHRSGAIVPEQESVGAPPNVPLIDDRGK